MNKLILFDIDGTLTSSPVGHIEAHAVAYQKVFGLYGSIYMVDYNGKTDRRITQDVLTFLNVDEATIREKMDEHLAVMEAYYRSIKDFIHPAVLPGVADLLGYLHDNEQVLIGSVTGNLSGIARTKLEVAGLAPYFQFGGFGETSLVRADLVTSAITQARERGFTGDDVFVVGDTPSDIEAGTAAGVYTIGVASGSYGEAALQAAGATATLPNLIDQRAFRTIVGI